MPAIEPFFSLPAYFFCNNGFENIDIVYYQSYKTYGVNYFCFDIKMKNHLFIR